MSDLGLRLGRRRQRGGVAAQHCRLAFRQVLCFDWRRGGLVPGDDHARFGHPPLPGSRPQAVGIAR